MGRAVLQACLPWLALFVVLCLCLWLLARLNGTRPRLGRVLGLHGDENGTAQSLSFVLVLPFFVMIMLFIVQVSQLMIGTIVVHYAAFAAARSAIVWIPATLGDGAELENGISAYYPDPEATDQVVPILDPDDESYGPADGGMTMLVAPGSPKYEKIVSAAVMACVPISPSRDLGLGLSGRGGLAGAILKEAYRSMAPDSVLNTRIPRRLENKLAYALENTWIEIRFFHMNSEPPLVTYLLPRDIGEFHFNELGWQNPITVNVRHDMALLPGPGRLLARKVRRPDRSPDEVAEKIERSGNVYVYSLTASATLGNEGEKSVIPYAYHLQ